ncbi:MAG: sugar phosphate isomerase/epimerase [Oscillospiraceae bacterium]|nr:sugar phosphate isomerase/epimerase [Oscillospiraceae bacterium]
MKTAFSLETVNTRYQEPNRNRVESKYYWEELFQLVGAGGFHAVELPYDPGFMGARCCFPFSKVVMDVKFGGVEGFKKVLADAKIDKIAGIFASPRAAGSVEQYVEGFKRSVKGMLGLAGELGCDYVTVSASPEYCTMGALLDKKAELLDALAAALGELADEAGDIKLCVRNEFWGILRGAGMHDFMAKVDKRVGYCVDLAHIKIAGEDPAEFIRKAGDRVGVVILTDTCFEDKDEVWKGPAPAFPRTGATQVFKDLGQGSVDLCAVFAALKEVGFDGWATVDNRQTRQVSRGILRARYALNAVEG